MIWGEKRASVPNYDRLINPICKIKNMHQKKPNPAKQLYSQIHRKDKVIKWHDLSKITNLTSHHSSNCSICYCIDMRAVRLFFSIGWDEIFTVQRHCFKWVYCNQNRSCFCLGKKKGRDQSKLAPKGKQPLLHFNCFIKICLLLVW